MKDLKKPDFMSEAAAGSKKHHWLYYVFICIVLYYLGSMAVAIGIMPFLFKYLMNTEAFQSMLDSQRVDMQKITELIMKMPDHVMVVMLYLQILIAAVFMLFCRFGEKRKLRTMGMTKKHFLPSYGLGMLFGAVIFSLIYFLAVASGGIVFKGIAKNVSSLWIIVFFGGYIIQGFTEEIVFRGFLFTSLAKRYSVVMAIFWNAVMFSAFHSMNDGVSNLAFINLFLFGVLNSLVVLYSENIWMSAAIHSVWNFVQGNVYQIKVSGMKEQVSIFSSQIRPGHSLITGGNFGLEGGIVTTIVLLAGITLMYRLLTKKENGNAWVEIPLEEMPHFQKLQETLQMSDLERMQERSMQQEERTKQEIVKSVSKPITTTKTCFNQSYFGGSEEKEGKDE